MFYHAADMSSQSPIQPGGSVYIQNLATGHFCKLAPLATNATQLGLLCNQMTAGTATAFLYTGTGLAAGGQQLVATGVGQPLLLANTTTAPVSSLAFGLTISAYTTTGGWA
jgi:hypothetical protein